MVGQRIAFVSMLPPQSCRLADYTGELMKSVARYDQQVDTVGVAVIDAQPSECDESSHLKLRRNKPTDYRRVANAINANGVDCICVQHAFGLYGGPNQAGEYLETLLSRLDAPVITTLHTVLPKPSKEQIRMIRTTANRSEKVVVMTNFDRKLLQKIYQIPATSVVHIPYGIPDTNSTPIDNAKDRLGLAGRTLMMTSGSIGSGKGVEAMLEALPEIIRHMPDVLYIILNVKSVCGHNSVDALYRHKLDALIAEYKLERHVVFQEGFLNAETLSQYLQAADFVILPDLSGHEPYGDMLAYALGAGKAIISTPSGYAKEFLSDGSGRIVAFDDSRAIAESILALHRDPECCQRMRKMAHAKSRKMTWTLVGQAYEALFINALNTV